MNKLINSLKSVNKFALVLILAAAGLIFTQSAFKASKLRATTEYVLIPGTGWTPKGVLQHGEDPGDYNCNESITTTCSGFFDNDNPPTSPSDQPLNEGKRLGQFYIVED